jgi:glycerol-3-phosphate dehydrogenase
VRPLSFTWPVYEGARVTRWKLAAALTLYDALALFRNVGRHVRLSARRVLTLEPRVRHEGLRGGARYWDAATDDARLTLANVIAARDAGAVIINHARVEALLRDGGRVAGARVRVAELASGAPIDVKAKVVVNATGPWSDRIERLTGEATRASVRGSKGVHVAVPRERIGNRAALTLLAPQDGRVMFTIPAGDFAIVGTTDTFETVSPDEVRATSADVAYLLAAANHFFPEARLTPADVVASWAGLRPLATQGLQTSANGDPGRASREHAIAEQSRGLISVTGGKLTTYRAMAREVVDAVQRSLGAKPTRTETARRLLPGGALSDVEGEIAYATGQVHDEAVARRLVHAHGTAWREVWALVERDATLGERVEAGRPYLLAELRYGVERELALTLGDLLIRRVPLAFETRDSGRAAAGRVAPRVAEWLGWSAAQTTSALADYDAEVARMFTIEDATARLP